jgi:hypothetical protein
LNLHLSYTVPSNTPKQINHSFSSLPSILNPQFRELGRRDEKRIMWIKRIIVRY